MFFAVSRCGRAEAEQSGFRPAPSPAVTEERATQALPQQSSQPCMEQYLLLPYSVGFVSWRSGVVGYPMAVKPVWRRIRCVNCRV
jgi:hypothetical protein